MSLDAAGVLSVDQLGNATEGVAAIDWTDSRNHRRLRQQLRSPIVFALLDLAAERPGEFFSLLDVAERTGHTGSLLSISASLGSLTTTIRQEFSVSYADAKWPVRLQKRPDSTGVVRWHYVMDKVVADCWERSKQPTGYAEGNG